MIAVDLLVGLALSLGALVAMTRWFGVRVQRLAMLVTGDAGVTLWVYFLLLLPGALLHELSHWSVANLLGVRTRRILIGPSIGPGQTHRVQFGGVVMQRADPVRAGLIGLAPLVTGTLVVLWIARSSLGLVPTSGWSLYELLEAVRPAFARQDAWLYLYLIIAISNAMLPSASDRQAWGILGLYLLGLVALLYFAGALTAIPTGAISWMERVVQTLIFAFALTAFLDLSVGAVLLAIEALLALILKRRRAPQ